MLFFIMAKFSFFVKELKKFFDEEGSAAVVLNDKELFYVVTNRMKKSERPALKTFQEWNPKNFALVKTRKQSTTQDEIDDYISLLETTRAQFKLELGKTIMNPATRNVNGAKYLMELHGTVLSLDHHKGPNL